MHLNASRREAEEGGGAIRILSDQHLQLGLFPYQGHMSAVEEDGVGMWGAGECDGSGLAGGNRAAKAQTSASRHPERRVQRWMEQRVKQSRRCVFSDLEEIVQAYINTQTVLTHS